MKTIYTAIIDRLSAKVPALKWIDLDTGQLDAAVRPSVAYPAAIISIGITTGRNITDRHQTCRARIILKLAFNNTPDRTSAGAPDDVRRENLKVYDVIADVYAALQGFETQHFNALQRVNQGKVERKDGIFLYNITFECDFEDTTAEI